MTSAHPPPIAFDRSTRCRGATLTGGSPRRALRLTDAGWGVLADLARGTGSSPAALDLRRRLLDAGIAHPRPRRHAAVSSVTVVVPVRDRAAGLDRCLSALGHDGHVIVVDDCSHDRQAIGAVAARHRAQLIRRVECGGPAAARNTALPEVQTELLAFVDSDCMPEPGWLHRLVGHFEDPLVAAVAPRLRPQLNGGLIGRYLAARSPLDMGERESVVEPGRPVSYVPSAALLVRRSALDGGFDERLRYGEDVDLVWRLRDAGWRVRYDPTVVVAHREPARLRHALTRRFHYGTSAAALASRHPGRLAPVVVSPLPAIASILLLAGHPAGATVVAARGSTALARRLAALGLPTAWAPRWFGEATYHAAFSFAQYLTMFALPLAPAVLVAGRRRRLLGLLALPALDGWWRRRPPLDPIRWTALWLADDAAYGTGVLWGCLKTATVGPLIPALSIPSGAAESHQTRVQIVRSS